LEFKFEFWRQKQQQKARERSKIDFTSQGNQTMAAMTADTRLNH